MDYDLDFSFVFKRTVRGQPKGIPISLSNLILVNQLHIAVCDNDIFTLPYSVYFAVIQIISCGVIFLHSNECLLLAGQVPISGHFI